MSSYFHQSARTDGFTLYITEKKGDMKHAKRNLNMDEMLSAVKEYAEKGYYCVEVFNEQKLKEASK